MNLKLHTTLYRKVFINTTQIVGRSCLRQEESSFQHTVLEFCDPSLSGPGVQRQKQVIDVGTRVVEETHGKPRISERAVVPNSAYIINSGELFLRTYPKDLKTSHQVHFQVSQVSTLNPLNINIHTQNINIRFGDPSLQHMGLWRTPALLYNTL